MRPQARAFAVEIRPKRKATNGSHRPNGWATLSDDGADELPPDDLPARDVHAHLEPQVRKVAALEAANRVFSALLSKASPGAPSTSNLASVVFRSPAATVDTKVTGGSDKAKEKDGSTEVRREPRVLPSLLSANPLEREDASPPRSVARKPKRPRQGTEPARGDAVQLTNREAAEAPSSMAPPAAPRGVGSSCASGSRRRSEEPVLPRGERWKRRLPKACW
jgi:hypothetical protein